MSTRPINSKTGPALTIGPGPEALLPRRGCQHAPKDPNGQGMGKGKGMGDGTGTGGRLLDPECDDGIDAACATGREIAGQKSHPCPCNPKRGPLSRSGLGRKRSYRGAGVSTRPINSEIGPPLTIGPRPETFLPRRGREHASHKLQNGARSHDRAWAGSPPSEARMSTRAQGPKRAGHGQGQRHGRRHGHGWKVTRP